MECVCVCVFVFVFNTRSIINIQARKFAAVSLAYVDKPKAVNILFFIIL